jgi:hypothetical protein
VGYNELSCTAVPHCMLQVRLGAPNVRRDLPHLQQQQQHPKQTSSSSKAPPTRRRRPVLLVVGNRRWTLWLWALLMRLRRLGHACWRGCRSSAVESARPLRTSSVSGGGVDVFEKSICCISGWDEVRVGDSFCCLGGGA